MSQLAASAASAAVQLITQVIYLMMQSPSPQLPVDRFAAIKKAVGRGRCNCPVFTAVTAESVPPTAIEFTLYRNLSASNCLVATEQ